MNFRGGYSRRFWLTLNMPPLQTFFLLPFLSLSLLMGGRFAALGQSSGLTQAQREILRKGAIHFNRPEMFKDTRYGKAVIEYHQPYNGPVKRIVVKKMAMGESVALIQLDSIWYRRDGQMIKKVKTVLPWRGNWELESNHVTTHTYYFSPTGNLEGEAVQTTTPARWGNTFQYDPEGRVTELMTSGRSHKTYTYDGQKVTVATKWRESDSHYTKVDFIFNDQGKVMLVIPEDKQGYDDLMRLEYDDQGRMLTFTSREPDGEKMKSLYRYHYDDLGYITHEEYHQFDYQQNDEVLHTFNNYEIFLKEGQPSIRKWTSAEEDFSYCLAFDEHGNPTNLTTYINNQVVYEATYEILYYDE